MKPEEVLALAPVMPVVVINDAAHAVPMARALIAGGVRAIEITLRTEAALDAIRAIAADVPEAVVGAGTVLTPNELTAATQAGARFALSPGATPHLLAAGRKSAIPFIPGVATAGEIMVGYEHGYTCFKFFPAEQMGGIATLKGLGSALSAARFCPTGGIGPDMVAKYLALPNVICVGGSWVTPADKMAARDWDAITALARQAAGYAKAD
jgi:2-dehydro-3-deoxyphosphogluconate aldolase/(4S)-4-hydroxy-2-oxoglutarate aldolase